MIAEKVSKLAPAVIDAIRENRSIPDPRFAALSSFTRVLLTTRGLPSTNQVEAFLAAGYQERHVLEIILAIAVKTLSNYSNHLFHTPLDAAFTRHEWKEPAA
jgi:alkylhydroperoxidase family enzyme